MSRSNGTTYIEIVYAVAILGICILMLNVSIQHRKESRIRATYQTRVMAALMSEADLIRSLRGDSLTPGRHDFIRGATLLRGLPGARGSYVVAQSRHEGVVRVEMTLRWRHRGNNRKELTIHVRP